MKFWLILITIILMTLKVAQAGLAADMSWWLVFAPLLAWIACRVVVGGLFLFAAHRLMVLRGRHQ